MKNLVKIISWALLIAILGLTFFMPKNSYGKEINKSEYKAVLTIWQIDSFEGGKGSRTSFLRGVSLNFSKKYKGVLTLVVSHTVESAKRAIAEGKVPDVVSIGASGLDFSSFQKEIKNLSAEGGGVINGKRYFIAWAKGGYYKITKGDGKKIVTYECENNSPLIALALAGECKSVEIKSREDAFQAFLNSKNATLIGTHRDVYRLQNRNVDCVYTPLGEFCDLYQYALITSKDNEYYSRAFIEYLLLDETQDKLTNLSMFSTVKKGLYRDNEPFSMGEKQEIKYLVSPFYDKNTIEKLNEIAKEVINGSKGKEELIKYL